MKSYEEFVEIVMKKAEEYMAVSHADFEVKRRTDSSAEKKDDMLLLENRVNERMVIPAFSLSQLYEEYCQTGNDNSAIIKLLVWADKVINEVSKSGNEYVVPEGPNDRIIYELINKANNVEKLMNVPHRDFYDMAIIYRQVFESTDEYIAGAVITNGFAETLGMDEEALYQCAAENTKNLFPAIVKPMAEVLEQYMEEEEMEREIQKPSMYIITNKMRIHGAICMLDKETLGKLAEKLEDDLYLLPSSTHEIIAVPANLKTLEFWQTAVKEINQNENLVSQEEMLSNTVFYFDKQTMELQPMDEMEEWCDMDEADESIGMIM